MYRCKLEYMLKNVDIKEKNKMIELIDPRGVYEFREDISSLLLDPDTKDSNILYSFPQFKYFPDEKDLLINKFIRLYKQINELCRINNINPFFNDPTNVSECEKTRLALIRVLPEEYINDFFGVGSFRDYKPPKYDGE